MFKPAFREGAMIILMRDHWDKNIWISNKANNETKDACLLTAYSSNHGKGWSGRGVEFKHSHLCGNIYSVTPRRTVPAPRSYTSFITGVNIQSITPDLGFSADVECPIHAVLYVTRGHWLHHLLLHCHVPRKFSYLKTACFHKNGSASKFVSSWKMFEDTHFDQRKLLETSFSINWNIYGLSFYLEPLAKGLMG